MNNFIIKKRNSGYFILNITTLEKKPILIDEDSQLIYAKDKFFMVFKNNDLYFYQILDNKEIKIIDEINNISQVFSSNDSVLYSYQNEPSVFFKYGSIDKYFLSINSNVLYCDNNIIIYSSDNKTHIKSKTQEKILNFNVIAFTLKNDNIGIYVRNNYLYYISLNDMKILKTIALHQNIDAINCIKILPDMGILISTDKNTIIIENDKITKIFNDIEYMSPIDMIFKKEDSIQVNNNLSIIVTCHAPYIKYLPSCLKSINTQSIQPKSKILVLDNVKEDLDISEEWSIIKGEWNNPNTARNVGLQQIDTKWVIYFDVDNIMEPNYLKSLSVEMDEAKESVGFLYKNIVLDNEGFKTKHPLVKAWDYWALREGNYIDTSSVWRKDALIAIGGWDEDIKTEDDYNLVLRLSSKGWKGQYINNNPASVHNSHQGRWKENYQEIMPSLFNSYTFTIVSLISGREDIYEEWVNAIIAMKKPLYVNWVILDDSNNNVEKELKKLYNINGFKNISIMKSYLDPQVLNSLIDKHKRVANLYNYVLSNIQTDFILTIEDDVIVPPSGFQDLFSIFEPKHTYINSDKPYYGASAGLYQSPSNAELAVVALDYDKWQNMPKYEDMKNKSLDAGFVGGGCTLWFNGILKKVLPMQPNMVDGELYGWDSDICKKIRSQGYLININGNVICNHKMKKEGLI